MEMLDGAFRLLEEDFSHYEGEAEELQNIIRNVESKKEKTP